MKYLTLIEILKAILYFFLGGIASKIGWSLAKFAFMFLREMLLNLRHSFASALKYPLYSKNKNIKESRAGKFALEFLFTSLICVFFLLSSYALLDGQLRLFSVACFALGMWFAELLIRRVKNFALVFAFHFVSFFGKIFHVFFYILFLPLRILVVLLKRVVNLVKKGRSWKKKRRIREKC